MKIKYDREHQVRMALSCTYADLEYFICMLSVLYSVKLWRGKT